MALIQFISRNQLVHQVTEPRAFLRKRLLQPQHVRRFDGEIPREVFIAVVGKVRESDLLEYPVSQSGIERLHGIGKVVIEFNTEIFCEVVAEIQQVNLDLRRELSLNHRFQLSERDRRQAEVCERHVDQRYFVHCLFLKIALLADATIHLLFHRDGGKQELNEAFPARQGVTKAWNSACGGAPGSVSWSY